MNRRIPPLAATALVTSLSGAMAADLAFVAVPAPGDDAAKRQVVVSPSVTMNGATAPIAYHVLARSGDRIGDGTFGMLTAKDGSPVGGAASNNPDFTSILPVGGKLFSVSHFEELPGAMYVSEMKQEADGTLSLVWTKPVDFAGVGGLWDPCAGSVTAWGTHLGSEEYPQDARKFETAAAVADFADDEVLDMARYAGLDPATMTMEDYRRGVNPYAYGFPTEVTVKEDGTATPVKHYSMGRVSVELAEVMPDSRTAYISDDGTNVGLFRYVADKEADLTAGALFAAKWTQTSDADGGAADISWVALGHATDAEVGELIGKGTKFSDIFETADISDDGTCPDGFVGSNAEGRAECLKLKPGMEVAASRLETRRYASMLGATTEFRKMEGQVYNPDRNSIYVAMSEIGKGMTDADEKADKGGRNDIRLARNPCGAVYEMALDDAFVGTGIRAAVVGKPVEYPADSPYAGTECDIDGIASPDNVTYMPGYDTLVIGEDTGNGHQNDAVWAVNTGTGVMTRIMTTPYGAEATSVDWYPNVGGHGYLVAVVQHPFGESDEDQLKDPGEARGYVGYIGPFPAAAVN